MSLIRFDKVSLKFGDQMILMEADLAIEPDERVCLIGRNGAGKSTTFKLITGEMEPDSGEIVPQTGLVVSQLAQSLPEAMDHGVRDVVKSGLTGIQTLLDEYLERSREGLNPAGLRQLEELHRQIGGSRSPRRWCKNRTCYCWMSRRTIWIL
jgi:ATP-binding cassette subfamily F protein uup